MRSAASITFLGLAVVAAAGALPGSAAKPAAPVAGASHNGVRACRPVSQRFHSRPDLHPVGICIGRRVGRVGAGYLMIAPKLRTGSVSTARGPEIVDDAGNLIWMHPDHWSNDLQVARFGGRPVLAWWDGRVGRNGHIGQYEVMDEHYDVIAEIAAGGHLDTDMHEIVFTARGTVIVGSHPVYHDRRTGKTVSGDYVITELDPATKRVVFRWRARDHIPPTATYRPMPKDAKSGWDAYHGNSIQVMRDGNLLVSMRNMSAIYKINRHSGRIMWTLGGKRDSFGFVSRHRSWQFCHQHDARELSNGHIMLFDNGGNYTGGGCRHHLARVEEFALNPHRHTARLVRVISSRSAAPDGRGYVSWFVGSARRLDNGNTLVDWGSMPVIDEFSPRGKVVFDMRMNAWTYRAVRGGWVGRPLDKPAIAMRRRGSKITVWVSWNGATEVASWRILTGADAESLQPAGSPRRRTGFETQLTTTTADRLVAAQALDAHGNVLGTSRALASR